MSGGIELSRSDIEALNSIYPVDGIFVRRATLYPDRREVVVTCAIPEGVAYTSQPVPYATKEHQVRCLSQGTYALVGGLLESGIPLIEGQQTPLIGRDEFLERQQEFQLFYRREDLVYKRNVPTGQEFQFTIRLGNAERRRQFTVAEFNVDGPTTGTVTFVGR